LAFVRKAPGQLLLAGAVATVGAILATVLLALAVGATFAATLVAAATFHAGGGDRRGRGKGESTGGKNSDRGQGPKHFRKHDELTFWLMEYVRLSSPTIRNRLIPQNTNQSGWKA
jgi:hypothetical protein